MKITQLIPVAGVCMAFASCSDNDTFTPNHDLHLATDTTITTEVNVNATHQTINGFAASDAWMMNYVGKYWSSSEKEDIAKLLFSQTITNGQPEGIGLSTWRVNIGGGTEEQGESSGISTGSQDHVTKRVECFLKSDGTYDWTKQSGQQYFMQKAKEYGCNDFVFFSNTPPVYYTKNGKGYNTGTTSNLKEDCYGKFADFLTTVTKHFQDEGYNVSMLSPVNEPQYSWDGQEGTPWTNAEIAKLAKELDNSLTAKSMNTQLLLAEAGKWSYLYEKGDAKSESGSAIDAFFNPSSASYIGNLKHMPKIICAHSYYEDRSWAQLESVRSKARTEADKYGLSLYQTEWSMLGDDKWENFSSYDDASYMDLALTMSEVIHKDLVTANASSWAYWTSVSPERWSQKSRFYLIKTTPADGDYGDMKKSGTHEAGRNLWVLGNYSLFIRPGYQRVDLTIPNENREFFGSAFISPERDKLVVVYTNMSSRSVTVNTNISGSSETPDFQQYNTSADSNLKLQTADYLKGIIPSKSVCTLVYNLK